MMPSSAAAGIVRSLLARSPLASNVTATRLTELGAVGRRLHGPAVGGLGEVELERDLRALRRCRRRCVAAAVVPTAASLGSEPRTEITLVGVGVPDAAVRRQRVRRPAGRSSSTPRAPGSRSACVACSVSIFCSVSTSVNCAVCVRNCVLSAGFIGSWYFNCATSSVRNVFSLSWLLPLVVGGRVGRRRGRRRQSRSRSG